MSHPKPVQPLFVGRREEIAQFEKVLANPAGQAVLVVGAPGIGKSALLEHLAHIASDHPHYKCGAIRYEVTPADAVDTVLALMLDHAFDAFHVDIESLNGSKYQVVQWKAFLSVCRNGALVASHRRDAQRSIRDQFLERLHLISARMPDSGRAVFLIDPENHVARDSEEPWAAVIRQLPPKIKFIFAQRPDDVLATGRLFCSEPNVVRIPAHDLTGLDEASVEKLLAVATRQLGPPDETLRKALAAYHGHPYAIRAALDLFAQGVPARDWPADPTQGIAAAQWQQVSTHGPDAIKLFEAHAILKVAVSDDITEAVAGISRQVHQRLLAIPYLSGLLRHNAGSRRLYHTLLSEYVRSIVSPHRAKALHARAAGAFRAHLTAGGKPDALAAERLPLHVLMAEGSEAFVVTFVRECFPTLFNLGLVAAIEDLTHSALAITPLESAERAVLLSDLGLTYGSCGDLDRAEAMHKEALAIDEKLGRLQGVAADSSNLGLIYQARGDLDRAEPLLKKSLVIHEKLGRSEATAADYGHLGLLFQARGDLDRAEAMLKKALEILERLDLPEALADHYSHLALLCRARGELDRAVAMHKKALVIDEQLQRLERLAADYGNLGLIYRTRGDLDWAEDMIKKSLAINDKLGRLEGLAADYGNLGLIQRSRGNLDQAEALLKKALEIQERLGLKEYMANQYANLGLVYRARGDLAQAEAMHKKALAIDKDLGRLEGLATDYGNLGLLSRARGDLNGAEVMLKKALTLNEKIGRLEGLAADYGNLGLVYRARGDLDRAWQFWTKARDLFRKIGMPKQVTQMQHLLNR